MGQLKDNSGTKKDLVFYRLQTAKSDTPVIMMTFMLPAVLKQNVRLQWQKNLLKWWKNIVYNALMLNKKENDITVLKLLS